MKKFLLVFVVPVLLGLFVFAGVTYFLSQKDAGKGALQVTSVPQSNVYLNNAFIGQTPLCKCDGQNLLPTGNYTIKLVPTDSVLQPFEQSITINKSVLTVVDRTFGQGALSQGSIITLIPQANTSSGSLSLISFPSGATVTLDGNSAGTSPLTLANVVASDHDLVVSKPGYSDKTIRIHTVNGYQLSVLAFLAINPQALSATSSASTNVATSSAQGAQTKVTIASTPTGFLNVRSTPSLSGAVVSQVHPGESYVLVSEQNGWTQIKLADGSEGWVSSEYVTKQE